MLLDGVSFDFEDGKVYGLLGPNGAGKTTLMKAMLGLAAHSGKVLSDGHPARSGEFGSLIEYPAFYPRLTARENLELHARYLGMHGADVMSALAEGSRRQRTSWWRGCPWGCARGSESRGRASGRPATPATSCSTSRPTGSIPSASRR